MIKQSDDRSLLQYFENIQTKKQKEFVHLNNNCLFCQEALDIQYEKRFVESFQNPNEIREHVFCPNCELKSKSRYHLIH